MSSFVGSFTAVSQKSGSLYIRPQDKAAYSLTVGGGDSFIGRIVFQQSLNGQSWSTIAEYVGTASVPLTGTVVSAEFQNKTALPVSLRFFCDQFSTSPASDPIGYSLADAAGPVYQVRFLNNAIVNQNDDELIRFTDAGVEIPGDLTVGGTLSFASLSVDSLTVNGPFTVNGDGSNAGFAVNSSNAVTIGVSGGTQTHVVNGAVTATRNAFFGSSLSSGTMVGAAGGSILTSTSQSGFEVVGTHGNSSATTAVYGFRSNMTTTNASYTSGLLVHFNHSQASIGASHAVTREISFRVGPAGTGGTVSNFSGVADNSTFTGNWFINSTSTNPSLLSGNLGIGGSPSTAYGARINITGVSGTISSADATGFGVSGSFASTATTGATGAYLNATTANSSFTCPRLVNLWIDNTAKGAASTITRRMGAWIETPTDGTNNAALVLGQSTLNFTGSWNIYSDSTAPSRFGNGASFIVGSAALSTSATDGFLYIPTCAGAPTGVPTAQTGTVAIVFDTTNNRFYVYDGGWVSVALA